MYPLLRYIHGWKGDPRPGDRDSRVQTRGGPRPTLVGVSGTHGPAGCDGAAWIMHGSCKLLWSRWERWEGGRQVGKVRPHRAYRPESTEYRVLTGAKLSLSLSLSFSLPSLACASLGPPPNPGQRSRAHQPRLAASYHLDALRRGRAWQSRRGLRFPSGSADGGAPSCRNSHFGGARPGCARDGTLDIWNLHERRAHPWIASENVRAVVHFTRWARDETEGGLKKKKTELVGRLLILYLR